MGIPMTPILKEKLKEIDEELKKRFRVSIKYVRSDEKFQANRKPLLDKPAVLFEYFVLYNSLLALEPDEIKLILKSKGGASFLIPGEKYYKSISKYGETLQPSIIARKNGEEFGFWFDRPFIYFEEKLATLRPDIVIRKGKFEFKDMSYQKEEKVQLFKNDEIMAEFGNYSIPFPEEKDYQIRVSNELFGHKLYFKFKNEFIHTPLIIECKGFGGVFGNPEEYADFAKVVAIITPEKAYEPKKENLFIIRIENAKRISNSDVRNKIKEFYSQFFL